jgi:hypothetical protein
MTITSTANTVASITLPALGDRLRHEDNHLLAEIAETFCKNQLLANMIFRTESRYRAIFSDAQLHHEYFRDGKSTLSRFGFIGGEYQTEHSIVNAVTPPSGPVQEMARKISLANYLFTDMVINGEANYPRTGFLGLDKILAGTDNESFESNRWKADSVMNNPGVQARIMKDVDLLLSRVNGPTSVLVGTGKVIRALRGAAISSRCFTDGKLYGTIDLMISAKTPDFKDVIPASLGGNRLAPGSTSLYAINMGMDENSPGLHAVTPDALEVVKVVEPYLVGSVIRGSVELGPFALTMDTYKSAAVNRNVKLV